MFSVALSLGSPPAAVSRHPVSMEPGLSSTVVRRQRPSSRLTGAHKGAIVSRVKSELHQARKGRTGERQTDLARVGMSGMLRGMLSSRYAVSAITAVPVTKMAICASQL